MAKPKLRNSKSSKSRGKRWNYALYAIVIASISGLLCYYGDHIQISIYHIFERHLATPDGTVNRSQVVLASASKSVDLAHRVVNCSDDYREEPFAGCTPTVCGRGVTDTLIPREMALVLRGLASRGLQLGGSSGGVSVLNLHTGALSYDDKFVDVYKLIRKRPDSATYFQPEALEVYDETKRKIKLRIANHFGVDPTKLFLTSPTFFSRMEGKPARTLHDEYWHSHVDKVTYESFHYTALLYLSDYGTDFHGGRFVFDDLHGNTTVEPRLGRVSFFTSGSENKHHVERVTDGLRYAVTVAFTCDPTKELLQ